MMQVMRTPDGEIISMLMACSDSVRNMVAATPGCPRMPLPITETFARPFWARMVRAPISFAIPLRMRSACRPSADDTVKDMSVTPSWLAVCTITSAAMSASARGGKIAAATPGPGGTPAAGSPAPGPPFLHDRLLRMEDGTGAGMEARPHVKLHPISLRDLDRPRMHDPGAGT